MNEFKCYIPVLGIIRWGFKSPQSFDPYPMIIYMTNIELQKEPLSEA